MVDELRPTAPKVQVSGAAQASPTAPGRVAGTRSGAAAETNDAAAADPARGSSKAGRILGIRDSSGDRMEVRADETAGMIVRIVDAQGNVIRQVPPDELIALARRLDEAIGMLFDKRA